TEKRRLDAPDSQTVQSLTLT
ncbi:hypothetical protein EVA_19816, partial [gut metagenome]